MAKTRQEAATAASFFGNRRFGRLFAHWVFDSHGGAAYHPG
ncbi:conserved hypothetical protein [Acidithiobacillus caldus SM-1]|jgi:hypothetical protein|uniref:Uncharacterized protein n=2 Tax=Acidithiobacillus caldus TaxID=33059 RepID=F9ZL70_ACICS|nr:conserved hypothetical protein [Acidithiobacillus caldus SM-1]AIA54865.1 hypothetical protein Acaty_c0992 [Acidithiobacillus caldus ATCC 51756]QER43748.1 hypothetical protein F0726_00663 [Acidithiobacillus caldus]